MTCTCTLVTSGTASRGNRATAVAPAATRRAMPRGREDGCAGSRVRWRRARLLLLLHGSLEHGRLERLHAGDDDLFSFLEACQHRHEPPDARPEADLVHLEV